jgi:hypothetical protein
MAVVFQAAPQQVYESSIVFDDQHTMGDTRSVHQSIPGEPWQPGNRAASETTCTAAGAGTSTSVTAHVLLLTRKLNNSNASCGPEATSWTLRAEEWFFALAVKLSHFAVPGSGSLYWSGLSNHEGSLLTHDALRRGLGTTPEIASRGMAEQHSRQARILELACTYRRLGQLRPSSHSEAAEATLGPESASPGIDLAGRFPETARIGTQ